MPPKGKDSQTARKAPAAVVRQPISNSSLMWIPDDAVEGYQERLDRCVEWTLIATAIRHHKEICTRSAIPHVSFSEALQKKLNKSFLKGFLDEESTMTLEQHFEITVSLAVWDSEHKNEETKICFKNENNITDDIMALLRKAVKYNDREIIKRGLKDALVLRVTNSEMTYLDKGLKEFKKLTSLSLCGNFIDALDCKVLPAGLRLLELQANSVSNLDSFDNLPQHLLYVGLSRNILTTEGINGISHFPKKLTVLDLSDNDIYELEPLLHILARLPYLTSLLLCGNPCSVCAAYALTTVARLQRLQWLDNRKVLQTDRPVDNYEPHPDDLRSTYFNFTVLRIMSPPCPPKTEKGATGLFHVELTLPLLDPVRRSFLMYGRYESLVELLPGPEDFPTIRSHTTDSKETETFQEEAQSEETDIFLKLEPKNSLIINHYTTYESNKVPWAKMMSFQEPTVKIFCPDLRALRNTFMSTITLKLVYTLTNPVKKPDKKEASFKYKPPPSEFRVTIATIKCSLRNPDWSQSFQYFHWDATLETNDAIHWGDGDLAVIQYQQTQPKATKGKQDLDPKSEKQSVPEILTCHFGFGIDTLHA